MFRSFLMFLLAACINNPIQAAAGEEASADAINMPEILKASRAAWINKENLIDSFSGVAEFTHLGHPVFARFWSKPPFYRVDVDFAEKPFLKMIVLEDRMIFAKMASQDVLVSLNGKPAGVLNPKDDVKPEVEIDLKNNMPSPSSYHGLDVDFSISRIIGSIAARLFLLTQQMEPDAANLEDKDASISNVIYQDGKAAFTLRIQINGFDSDVQKKYLTVREEKIIIDVENEFALLFAGADIENIYIDENGKRDSLFLFKVSVERLFDHTPAGYIPVIISTSSKNYQSGNLVLDQQSKRVISNISCADIPMERFTLEDLELPPETLVVNKISNTFFRYSPESNEELRLGTLRQEKIETIHSVRRKD